jgi:TetR/AcrR family transcriptional regulator, cholesterol catabolism regulator
MVDIARATGISKAGLYYHFPRKQDLLAAIINLAHDILERDVQKALVDSRSDEDALRRIIHTHARLITREDDAAYAVLAVQEMRSLLPEDRAQIAGRKRAYLAMIRQRLDSLAASGRLDGIDPTVATHTLSGMVLWLSNWYHPNGRLPDDEVANQIARLAVNAVLPNGGS